MQDEMQKEQELHQFLGDLKSETTKLITKDARTRLEQTKLVNPQLAIQVEMYLLKMYKAGKISPPFSDGHLKEILNMIVQKPTWNITRK